MIRFAKNSTSRDIIPVRTFLFITTINALILLHLYKLIIDLQTVMLLINRCDSKITLQKHALRTIQIEWLTESWLREDYQHSYSCSASLLASKQSYY